MLQWSCLQSIEKGVSNSAREWVKESVKGEGIQADSWKIFGDATCNRWGTFLAKIRGMKPLGDSWELVPWMWKAVVRKEAAEIRPGRIVGNHCLS